MKVIWHSTCPISTSEMKKKIDEETDNGWTLQTLQTLLNRLIAEEYIEKDKRGKEYIYTPLVEEKAYVEYESEQFLKKIHGNSVVSFMKALFDSKKISDEDIAELEKILRDRKE